MRQGCLVLHICCVHGHDACVGCGDRREQDMVVAWNIHKSRGGGEIKKSAPSCVHRRREGQVRAGGVACVAVPAWCTCHGRTAWLGAARRVDGCGLGCCVWRGEGKREAGWVGCGGCGWVPGGGVGSGRGPWVCKVDVRWLELVHVALSQSFRAAVDFVSLVMLTNAREKALGHARALHPVKMGDHDRKQVYVLCKRVPGLESRSVAQRCTRRRTMQLMVGQEVQVILVVE